MGLHPTEVAWSPRRWPRFPSLVVTGDWPPAPWPGVALTGPHSCGTRVPSRQPPDRRAVGGQGAGREGGQLSGQQVLRGRVAAGERLLRPSVGPGGEGASLLSPPGPWSAEGISSL